MTNPLAPGSLDGLRALVTGSSRGIGADTATFLAEAGASVVINYRNKAARAEKLVAKLVEAGGSAVAIGADLTDAESVAALFQTVQSQLGGLENRLISPTVHCLGGGKFFNSYPIKRPAVR